VIELYDTTLRDGTQGEGICLTMHDKLRITELLDDFGVHLIEGGWPGSNPKDIEYFQAVRGLNLKHAQIAAFGSTCRPSLTPEEDGNLRELLASEAPVATLFGKSWTRHVTEVLRTDLDNNLRLIEQSVAYLRGHGRRVIYDAEHFFDGYHADADYALATLRAAIAGGAHTVVLCDTNGGTMPWQIDVIVRRLGALLDVPIGIHAHNDGGCAVANSMTALLAGAEHVQGTMNGIGERCGNADLCTIIANIELKTDDSALPAGKLERLTELARTISETCNVALPGGTPYVGRSAFAHKAGVHVAALDRDSGSYEHTAPASVGNHTRILVSELSGRGNIHRKAHDYGMGEVESETKLSVLERIKALENQGFAFESAEASVELLLRREREGFTPFFHLRDFMVVVEHREGRGHLAEANVKIDIDGQVHHTAAEGVGPVGALDLALRKALTPTYPAIEQLRLTDYKVRILDGANGTRAITRVLIDFSDGSGSWTTVGASHNIIEASWQALFDAFEYGLLRACGADRNLAELAESV
jgi:2-isopropylmalate synthase